MADPTLRELAQAVVDAGPTECVWPVNAPTSALLKALMPVVGDKSSPLYDTARAILAALDAERAQGYARAMGDAADRAMAVASSYGPKPVGGYAEGAQDALHSLTDDLDGTAKLAR